MAWCHHATAYGLNEFGLNTLSPCGITWGQRELFNGKYIIEKIILGLRSSNLVYASLSSSSYRGRWLITSDIKINERMASVDIASFPEYQMYRLCWKVIDTMMTSSNGNISRITDPLCGEFTGDRWITRTKASDAELWCFRWSVAEQTIEQTIMRLVIWDVIVPIMTSL